MTLPIWPRLRASIGVVVAALRGDVQPVDVSSGYLQVHSALLADVAAGLAGSDDLTEMLRRTLRATRDALGYATVRVFLLDEGVSPLDGHAVLCEVSSSIATQAQSDDSTDAAVAHDFASRALRGDEVVLVNGTAAGTDARESAGLAAASLAVPLRFDGTAIGVLSIDSHRAHAFTEHDVRTASILADQIAVAVSRWRLDRDRAARASEIERLQNFNQSIVEGIDEGIVVASSDGTISFANRRFEEMVGAESGELVGVSWQSMVPEPWRSRLGRGSTTSRQTESRLLTRDGNQFAVQVTMPPRRDRGVSAADVLLFTDISARLRADRVTRALSEAGLALRPADSEAALSGALAAEAVRTGLRVIVLLVDPESGSISLSLTALEPRRVRAAERALGGKLDNADVSGARLIAEMVRTTESAYFSDPGPLVASILPLATASDCSRVARLLGLGPTIAASMGVPGSLVGVVAVSHPDLEESDHTTATAFAHQVATALDRARLHAETQHRARQVVVLAEAAQLLAATAELEQLAEAVTERVRSVFEGDGASLYIADTEGAPLELAGSSGYTADEERVAEQTATSRHPGWVVANRRSILSVNALNDPRILYLGSRPRFSSVMMVPLVIGGGRCLGALGVSSRRLYAWSPRDLRLVTTLADQIAVAVANALRIREANRRALQLERVSEAGRSISGSLATPGLIDRAVAEAARVFEVTHAAVVLLGPDGSVSEVAQSPTALPIFLPTDNLTWVTTLAGPTVHEDLHAPGPFLSLEMRLVEAGVHSLIVAPLRIQGRSVGGLLLMAREGQRPFGSESIDLAQIAADQVAVAVENARLLRDTIDAHQHTEAVVSSSFTAMLTVDSLGRVQEANPAAAQLLSCSREALVGRLLDDALGTDLWLDSSGPIANARRSGLISPPREAVVTLPDGREREVLLGVAPLPNGYVVSMADITRLKDLDRLKTELVANVSHELRSPLASIKAYTELLLDELVPDPATNLRFLSVIDAQADRLGQCISNLLDLARVESDGYAVRRERFDLGAFMREAADAVMLRAVSKEIEVALELPAEEMKLNGDRPILFSSLKNLLDNAVKYSHPATRVLLRADSSALGLTLSVVDQGPGIPEGEWDRVFEKFYRVPSNERDRPEGSGLGLVIARQAARAHGGHVTVENNPDSGATFRLFLPADMVEFTVVHPVAAAP